MVKNDRIRMYCLNIDHDTECPQIDINVVGKQLQCVHGIGISAEKDDNSLGFAIVNACQYEVGLNLKLQNMVNLSKDVTVDIWWYLWNERFHGNIGIKRFVDCNQGNNLWECGQYRPGYINVNINKSITEIRIVLKPLSLTLGVTA